MKSDGEANKIKWAGTNKDPCPENIFKAIISAT
jgi:hypothetical protein